MAASCGTTRKRDDLEQTEDTEAIPRTLPATDVAVDRVHEILDRMSTAQVQKSNRAAPDENLHLQEKDEDVDAEALLQTSQINDAMKLTAKLWSRTQQAWAMQNVDTRGMSSEALAQSLQAGTKPRRKRKDALNPKARQSRAYIDWKEASIDAWVQNLRLEAEPPTVEQMSFLETVIHRCRQEAATFRRGAEGNLQDEPLRCCLLGIPGAGKSKCLKLLRRFFEECLKWEDGVQFQFLASQNTMAALIGGSTVHSWSTIPVNATDAANKIHGKDSEGDIDELFARALGMRWLIFDEVSTLSPYLLGVLETYLRRACCRHPYAQFNRRNQVCRVDVIKCAGEGGHCP